MRLLEAQYTGRYPYRKHSKMEAEPAETSKKRPREEAVSGVASPVVAARDCIQEGDTVIYLMHDSAQMGSMLKVNPREQQKIGSKRYSVRSLIGAPYGSVFELQQRHLQPVQEYAILGEVPEVATGAVGAGLLPVYV